MKITFIGQAGFLVEVENKKILIDPYLSDSVALLEPNNHRRIPVDEKLFDIKPDIIICTHNHGDHYDQETLKHYVNANSGLTFLAPRSAFNEAKKFGGNNNYVLFNVGTEWTDVCTFKAVKAEHSDDFAIGVIITYNGKNYYFTGDTLYNKNVIDGVKKYNIYVVFAPVNGRGNNMNKVDAVRFVKDIKAKYFVPIHTGMFDDIKVDDLSNKNVIIPTVYSEIRFDK